MSEQKNEWREIDSSQVWKDFLENNPQFEANFTQSFNWGLFHEQLKSKVFRRAYVKHTGELIAGYTAVLEIGKFYRFLTITGGPLLDWHDSESTESFRLDIQEIARRNSCCFIRIRPQVQDGLQVKATLKTIGFRLSPASLSVEFAGVLDLTLSDEQLMSNMSQSLRRKIRKAQKDEKIEIKVSKSKKDTTLFAKLHQEHAKLQKYAPFSEKRLVCQFETFAKDNQAKLYIAAREGEILAANMIFFYGNEASYHYGISTSAGQKYPSAPLLHLEAIKEARKQNLKIYNFWGIVNVDQTKHRYFGLSQFKRSFGIQEHRYTPSHDFVLKPFAYIFIWIFEFLRRKYRRL